MVKRLVGGSKLLGFTIRLQMLRHALQLKLANDGFDTQLIQNYLGHTSIMSTVRYTELPATKSKTCGGDYY
jgi:site-specific recombinase XerD